jgi:hypothetical protein
MEETAIPEQVFHDVCISGMFVGKVILVGGNDIWE